MNKIAILLTCHNRKDKTLRCLENVFSISSDYAIFLVDDGSTDGTSDEINKLFPTVNVIKGNGNLFWSRGMLLAWQTAQQFNYDFYIWLNDDVFLYPHAFDELFECSQIKNNQAIICGLIESKEREVIYGGNERNKNVISYNNHMNPVFHMHGNFVLIPKFVFETIGMIDPVYHHDLGDVEYGLRALKKGIGVFTTKKIVGLGEVNPICRERLNGTTIRKRFKRLYSPLGSNPFINFYFRKQHKSLANAIIYFIFQHFLNLIPDKLNKILFKNRYV